MSWFVPVWKVRASHGAHVRSVDAVAAACTNVPATHALRCVVVVSGVVVIAVVAVVVAVTMGGGVGNSERMRGRVQGRQKKGVCR